MRDTCFKGDFRLAVNWNEEKDLAFIRDNYGVSPDNFLEWFEEEILRSRWEIDERLTKWLIFETRTVLPGALSLRAKIGVLLDRFKTGFGTVEYREVLTELIRALDLLERTILRYICDADEVWLAELGNARDFLYVAESDIMEVIPE
jgi:hypothetical protein